MACLFFAFMSGSGAADREFLALLDLLGVEESKKNALLGLSDQQKLSMINAQKRTSRPSIEGVMQRISAVKKTSLGMYAHRDIENAVETFTALRFSLSTLTETEMEDLAGRGVVEAVWSVIALLVPCEWHKTPKTYLSVQDTRKNRPVYQMLDPAVRFFKALTRSPAVVRYLKNNPQVFAEVFRAFPSQYLTISEVVLELALKLESGCAQIIMRHLFSASEDLKEHAICVPLCSLRMKHILDEVYYNVSLMNITAGLLDKFLALLLHICRLDAHLALLADSLLRLCNLGRVLMKIKQNYPEHKREVDRVVEAQEACRKSISEIDVRKLPGSDQARKEVDYIINALSALHLANSNRVYDVVAYIKTCVLEEEKSLGGAPGKRGQVQLEADADEKRQSPPSSPGKVAGEKEGAAEVSANLQSAEPQQSTPAPPPPAAVQLAQKLARLAPPEIRDAQSAGPCSIPRKNKGPDVDGEPAAGGAAEKQEPRKQPDPAPEQSEKGAESSDKEKPTGLPGKENPVGFSAVPPKPPGFTDARKPTGLPGAEESPLKSVPFMAGAKGGLPKPPVGPPGLPGPPGFARAKGPGGSASSASSFSAVSPAAEAQNTPRKAYIRLARQLRPANPQALMLSTHLRKPKEKGIWSSMQEEDLGTFTREDFEAFSREKKEKGAGGTAAPRQGCSLLEAKKGKAIDIVLARVRIPLEDLVAAADNLDASPFSEILIKGILHNYPTDEEFDLLANYETKLVPEVFFKMSMRVGFFREKLVALHLQLNAPCIENALIPSLQTLVKGCEILKDDPGVEKVFLLTRAAVNVLNAGSKNEAAWGVRSESLVSVLQNEKLVALIRKKAEAARINRERPLTAIQAMLAVSPEMVEEEYLEYLGKKQEIEAAGFGTEQKNAVSKGLGAVEKFIEEHELWTQAVSELQKHYNEPDTKESALVPALGKYALAILTHLPTK